MERLGPGYYLHHDVVALAEDLIGKELVTCFDGVITSGRIVETEAYNGIIDKASHAYGGRRTARTAVMYLPGGHAYVYLCYGIHHLFNVVTNVAGTPHAILIRAIEPLQGIEVMATRTGKSVKDRSITKGPGNVSKALGISTIHTGTPLSGDVIHILDRPLNKDRRVVRTTRIGVQYAGPDADLLYRFIEDGNPYVSRHTG